MMRCALTIALGACLSGCGTDGTRLSDLSFSAGQCPEGGLVLETGIDADDNGALEGDEVRELHVICLGRAVTSCAVAADAGTRSRWTWWDGHGNIVREVSCPGRRRVE